MDDWKSIALNLLGLLVEYEKLTSKTSTKSVENEHIHILLRQCFEETCRKHPELFKFVRLNEGQGKAESKTECKSKPFISYISEEQGL